MTSRPSIFSPYDPLLEAASLFTNTSESNRNSTLSLRPVWIIGDLKTLHRWLTSAERTTNWSFDATRETLYQRYKNLLLSDQSQPFMIMENGSPLAQLDLLKLPSASPEKVSARLDFILEETFRDRDRFGRSLRFFIGYFFSFPEMREISIRLSRAETSLFAALEASGFEPVRPDPFLAVQTINYRLTRKNEAHRAS